MALAFLFNADGATDEQPATDDIGNTLVVFSASTIALDEAEAKFGPSSLRLNATEWCEFHTANGTGAEFTVAFWLKAPAQIEDVQCHLIRGWYEYLGNIPFRIDLDGYGNIAYSITSDSFVNIGGATSFPADQWVFVSLSWTEDGYIHFGLDGSVYSWDTGIIPGSGSTVVLGSGTAPDAYTYACHIDSIMVDDSVAMYTSNFTPPTAPFAAPSNGNGVQTTSSVGTPVYFPHQYFAVDSIITQSPFSTVGGPHGTFQQFGLPPGIAPTNHVGSPYGMYDQRYTNLTLGKITQFPAPYMPLYVTPALHGLHVGNPSASYNQAGSTGITVRPNIGNPYSPLVVSSAALSGVHMGSPTSKWRQLGMTTGRRDTVFGAPSGAYRQLGSVVGLNLAHVGAPIMPAKVAAWDLAQKIQLGTPSSSYPQTGTTLHAGAGTLCGAVYARYPQRGNVSVWTHPVSVGAVSSPFIVGSSAGVGASVGTPYGRYPQHFVAGALSGHALFGSPTATQATLATPVSVVSPALAAPVMPRTPAGIVNATTFGTAYASYAQVIESHWGNPDAHVGLPAALLSYTAFGIEPAILGTPQRFVDPALLRIGQAHGFRTQRTGQPTYIAGLHAHGIGPMRGVGTPKGPTPVAQSGNASAIHSTLLGTPSGPFLGHVAGFGSAHISTPYGLYDQAGAPTWVALAGFGTPRRDIEAFDTIFVMRRQQRVTVWEPR